MTTPITHKKKGPIRLIIFGIIVIAGIWYFKGGGAEKMAQSDLSEAQIQEQIIHDAETQYEVAKRNGSPMDIYVRAGIVAEAYLQANDQENYKKWKQIEADAAIEAGVGVNK